MASGASGQTFANDDPILRSIWQEGLENSHTYGLSQALFDSIGASRPFPPDLLAVRLSDFPTFRLVNQFHQPRLCDSD